MSNKCIYRINFINHEKVFEIYAKNVFQSEILGFIEVESIIFGENSSVVVDPSEEHLKNEFQGVESTLIPIQSVVRIDAVLKTGVAKILSNHEKNIRVFPSHLYNKTTSKEPLE